MLHLEKERWRIFRLLCYKAFPEPYIEDSWIRLLVNDNDVAFKARVWFLIVQRLANLPDDESDIDLSAVYPRMASLLNKLETSVLLAYTAKADGNDVQMLAKALDFGINAAALAREMYDHQVANNICSCSNIDEYCMLLDVYFKRQNMRGLPYIVSRALASVKGEHFIDYRERTSMLSYAILEKQAIWDETLKKLLPE